MNVNKGPFIKWWCFASNNFPQVLHALPLQGFKAAPPKKNLLIYTQIVL